MAFIYRTFHAGFCGVWFSIGNDDGLIARAWCFLPKPAIPRLHSPGYVAFGDSAEIVDEPGLHCISVALRNDDRRVKEKSYNDCGMTKVFAANYTPYSWRGPGSIGRQWK